MRRSIRIATITRGLRCSRDGRSRVATEKLFRFAESQVTSQADHDSSGQRALTPAEAGRPANALAEWSGKQGHCDIGGGVGGCQRGWPKNKMHKDRSPRAP